MIIPAKLNIQQRLKALSILDNFNQSLEFRKFY